MIGKTYKFIGVGRGLERSAVKVIALMRNRAAKPDDYQRFTSQEELEAQGGLKADDEFEVVVWLAKPKRWSWATYDVYQDQVQG